VRARVENLQAVNTSITHETLSNAIVSKFCAFYGAQTSDVPVDALDMLELKKQPHLNKVYKELSDWNWRFGETPDFEHNIEQRFEWGTMDIHLNVNDGVVKQVKIFSDSLYPALVDEVRHALTGATYDMRGVTAALVQAKQNILVGSRDDLANENERQAIGKHIDELRDWLVTVI